MMTGDALISSYDSGATSFISQPVIFGGLAEVIKGLGPHWFEVVDRPRQQEDGK